MSTEPLSGHPPADADVFNITSAQRALSSEQTGRTRRYLVSMGIRTVCLIAAIVTPGWPRVVLIAAAVSLPYLAVVIANGGRENDAVGDLGVRPSMAPQLEAGSPQIITGVIAPPPFAEPR
ncbi:MAG: DUF3099 domain-containing protein [Actinomycetota bacterium]|nr:DUF3099 domain-containing protein [Actinomycetota bacterium]